MDELITGDRAIIEFEILQVDQAIAEHRAEVRRHVRCGWRQCAEYRQAELLQDRALEQRSALMLERDYPEIYLT